MKIYEDKKLESVGLAKEILKKAHEKKVQRAEVYLVNSDSTCLEIKDQEVDSFELARDNGIGLRVIVDGACGFSYSNDFSKDEIENLIAKSISSAKTNAPDKFRSFPGPVEKYP